MRLAWPVTREICGGDVGDRFQIDVDEPPAIKLRLRRNERRHDEWTICGYQVVDDMEGKREKSSLDNRQYACRSKAESMAD